MIAWSTSARNAIKNPKRPIEQVYRWLTQLTPRDALFLFGSVDPTDGLARAMALAWGRDEGRRKEAFDLNATKGRKCCEA